MVVLRAIKLFGKLRIELRANVLIWSTYGHLGAIDARLLEQPAVTIAIEDDGPGIPDTRKQEMFGPFVRGDAGAA